MKHYFEIERCKIVEKEGDDPRLRTKAARHKPSTRLSRGEPILGCQGLHQNADHKLSKCGKSSCPIMHFIGALRDVAVDLVHFVKPQPKIVSRCEIGEGIKWGGWKMGRDAETR